MLESELDPQAYERLVEDVEAKSKASADAHQKSSLTFEEGQLFVRRLGKAAVLTKGDGHCLAVSLQLQLPVKHAWRQLSVTALRASISGYARSLDQVVFEALTDGDIKFKDRERWCAEVVEVTDGQPVKYLDLSFARIFAHGAGVPSIRVISKDVGGDIIAIRYPVDVSTSSGSSGHGEARDFEVLYLNHNHFSPVFDAFDEEDLLHSALQAFNVVDGREYANKMIALSQDLAEARRVAVDAQKRLRESAPTSGLESPVPDAPMAIDVDIAQDLRWLDRQAFEAERKGNVDDVHRFVEPGGPAGAVNPRTSRPKRARVIKLTDTQLEDEFRKKSRKRARLSTAQTF